MLYLLLLNNTEYNIITINHKLLFLISALPITVNQKGFQILFIAKVV